MFGLPVEANEHVTLVTRKSSERTQVAKAIGDPGDEHPVRVIFLPGVDGA